MDVGINDSSNWISSHGDRYKRIGMRTLGLLIEFLLHHVINIIYI
jgi:hypothetical protein